MSEEYHVVVGVDGSLGSEQALRWALWHAELVGDSVVVAVRGWDYPELYDRPVAGPEAVAHRTAAALDETIARLVPGNCSVPVRREVVYGHPAKALLDVVRRVHADLLVVGSRGSGGFATALLGSVAQYCVRHAHCPVLVARGEPDGSSAPSGAES
ncbi:Nucleotide-binding universal stress protein, UspA family [Actinopolyspora alba]|uniref:Nucleotide-binding universal stress protein, UspA family n=1 Tax=Actinopolyspora alba TaxID=673379 RepID=A0A1I1ZPP3_9ACTN|nr:universal stress protein [Actinopolyspora alba]SFE33602.1 Nucleotide-binding universal stress protein, UspA family [Actinopolyspora alba]